MFQRFGTPAVQSKTFEAEEIEFVRTNVEPKKKHDRGFDRDENNEGDPVDNS